MREKQLAQEAKKLDAKVGGTKSWGLEEKRANDLERVEQREMKN